MAWADRRHTAKLAAPLARRPTHELPRITKPRRVSPRELAYEPGTRAARPVFRDRVRARAAHRLSIARHAAQVLVWIRGGERRNERELRALGGVRANVPAIREHRGPGCRDAGRLRRGSRRGKFPAWCYGTPEV
jgi:hypothetical protein